MASFPDTLNRSAFTNRACQVNATGTIGRFVKGVTIVKSGKVKPYVTNSSAFGGGIHGYDQL